jgi:hypothetical protein
LGNSRWGLDQSWERPNLTEQIRAHIGGSISDKVSGDLEDYFKAGDLFEEKDELLEAMEPKAQPADANEFTPDTFDEYLRVKVLLPRGGEQHMGTVRQWLKDEDGNPVGQRAANPLLDTRQYEVSFDDGATEAYTTNMIAENLYSQVDKEGRRQFQIMD